MATAKQLAKQHERFGSHWKRGWATCPTVVNGCIRIVSNPAYRSGATVAEISEHLRAFTATPHHHFWPDSVSLLDGAIFRHSAIRGHQKIADVYLLAVAVRNHGVLATFDRNIPLTPVHGATSKNLLHLGPG